MQLADLRYALRLWKRYPTLVLVAGVSLGLGIGATTTMFSVVNNVANYKLDFKDVDRLAVLWLTDKEQGNNQSPSDWETLQTIVQNGRSFESFGMFQGGGAPVTLSGVEVKRVEQMPTDMNGLAVMGVQPFLGRTYRIEDFDDVVKQKEARGIVVTYETWQSLLGGAPDVIGKTIHVDGEVRSVIGVMPKGFRLLPWADDIAFWAANDMRKIPKAAWMISVGRLKPGVTVEQAQADASVIVRSVLESRGQKAGGAGAKVELIHEAYFGGARRGLSFLLGAVSFVLLIACANVANMLLAAGAARQKELAVRVAAGAVRRRLMAQLLTENLLLSLVGCSFGMALAFGGVRLHAAIVPQGFPDLLRHNPIDLRVLAFALAISVFSSLLFGLIPALQASRVDVNDVLKEGGRGGSGTRRRGRSALLVAEVALAMVLLLGAGLMIRGFMSEQGKLPGFSTERLVTGEILLGGTRYFDKTPQDMNLVTAQVEVFYDQVLERVRALPGVKQAGIISKLPLQIEPFPFQISGQPVPDSPRKRPRADVNEVDAQALDTLGIHLLRGRGIDERDVMASPWVAVVSKTFADRHFAGQDPIGKTFRLSMGDPGPENAPSVDEPQLRTIVGVAADLSYPSFFDEKPAAIYIPFRQHMWQYAREDEWMHTRKVLALRTTVEPMTLVPSVQAAVTQVDRDQAAHDFQTMEARVRTSPSVTNSRFFASLFTIFGSLAILLAMVGVYGVMSWVVGQRTSEFGIRMALGAGARDIIRMLLGQSLRPILIGLALGSLGGYGLSRALNSMFFRMTNAEPLVFVAIASLMLAVALAAAWVPARRVTRIDPQQALRYE